MFIALSIILVIILSINLFIRYAPQFGNPPNGDALLRIENSENYQKDHFKNGVDTKLEMGFKLMIQTLREYMQAENTAPESPIQVHGRPETSNHSPEGTFITWYGHSTILLEIDNKKLLIDPMLGKASAPVPFFSKRFKTEPSINLDMLPEIDAILISHDHYDHMDYSSIMALKNKVDHFYVPLGVGSHLRHWGIEPSEITELDWWEAAIYEGIKITATPARHFSGRSTKDRNKTLWASWAIKGKEHSVFFSGDSGYSDHFGQIGKKQGPFDISMVECGQYNEKWADIHMMPEQSIQAHIDVNAKVMMPIHWGAFKLSLHTWTEPVERAFAEANRKNVPIYIPEIGKRFQVEENLQSEKNWVTENSEMVTLLAK